MLKYKSRDCNYLLLLLVIGLIFFNKSGFAGSMQEKELLSPEVQTIMQNNVINPIKPHLVFKTKKQANAWLNDMSNRLMKFIPDKFLRENYLTIIQYEAVRAGLDPQLVLSLITVESKFNKYAVSNVGARGLMQVMPFWLSQLGLDKYNLFDVQTNVRFGCAILRYYLQKENGNMFLALGRYNGSRGKFTYPNLVFKTYNQYWRPYPIITNINNGNKIEYIDYTKD